MKQEIFEQLRKLTHDWVMPGQYCHSCIVDKSNVYIDGYKVEKDEIDDAINNIATMVGNSIRSPMASDGNWLQNKYYSSLKNISLITKEDLIFSLDKIKYMFACKKAVVDYYNKQDTIVVITLDSEGGFGYLEFNSETELQEFINDCTVDRAIDFE